VIPRAHITAWRTRAPWPSNEQVEQDLVLSRALAAIFQHPVVAARLVQAALIARLPGDPWKGDDSTG
jgi:hypothetical protein